MLGCLEPGREYSQVREAQISLWPGRGYAEGSFVNGLVPTLAAPPPSGFSATEPSHSYAKTDASACLPQGAISSQTGPPLEQALPPATGTSRPDPTADRRTYLTDRAG